MQGAACLPIGLLTLVTLPDTAPALPRREAAVAVGRASRHLHGAIESNVDQRAHTLWAASEEPP